MTSHTPGTTPRLRTVRQETSIEGIGLHTGRRVRVRLKPSDETGLLFARIDLPGAPLIPAALRSVTQTTHATTLGAGEATVSTTEHLLAALWCNGVTNCRIEVDGPEIPILDGSAWGWQMALEEAGSRDLPRPRPIYGLRGEVEVREGGALVRGTPAAGGVTGGECAQQGLSVDVDVAYDRAWLEPQAWRGQVTAKVWRDELAAARTFTLEEWIEPLRSRGLIRGGSAENAIILYADGLSAPLRYATEMARHKALDLLGDIALLFGEDGGWLHAHLTGVRAGHELHRRWMAHCLSRDALLHLNPD